MRSLFAFVAFFSLVIPIFGEDQALEKPVDKGVLLKKAREYSAKAEFDKAIEIYDSLINLDVKCDDCAKLYDLRGFARLKQKAYDKAVADFTVAMEHEPKNARFIFNRGMAYHDAGQFEKALADYGQSLNLNRNSASTYAERGLLYLLMGEFEKAQDDFLAGYKIDPKSFYNVYGLAMLRAASPNEKLRNGKEALEYAEQSVKLEKRGLNANPAMAAAYAELGDFEKAIKWQQKAVEKASDDKKLSQLTAMEAYKAKEPLRLESKPKIAVVTQVVKPMRPGFNGEEDKVPPYTLPDPLVMFDGTPVKSSAEWRERRRPEILRLFETNVYGRRPDPLPTMRFEVVESDAKALDGAATRKQVVVLFNGKADGPRMDLLIYLPNQRTAKAPMFLGINFDGNQTVHSDRAILPCRSWVRNDPRSKIKSKHATEESRGSMASSWPIEKIIEDGYGVATFCCGDLSPDRADGLKEGVQSLFYKEGQVVPAADEWGTLAVWAWGLSRALDYLEFDPDIDAQRVAVLGHSRMGKTSLWAGAEDPRFALVISNDSGCIGAALSRRIFGETPERINQAFPHWMCGAFKKFDGRQTELPLDQHLLIALIAPRPVYIASASEDLWADPKGEFLAAKGASPVYELFGLAGLPLKEWPKPNEESLSGMIGYHLRPGPHALTAYDWERFLKFADLHMKK